MKQRLLITATLAILWAMSGSAYAANAVNAYQKNNSNQLTVTQSGTLASSAAIDQNGFDIATITQVGIAGTNDVKAIQDNAGSAVTPNTLTIIQNQGGNNAYIGQTTIASPTLPVGSGLNTGGLAGIAVGNTATITQDGSNNTTAFILQATASNIATLTQDASNAGTIIQNGVGGFNTATVVQQAIAGTAGTAATNDTATVNQNGANGTATVTQTGLAAFNAATITQDTTSNNVSSTVTQSGSYNTATVTQSNTYNIASVTQDGIGLSGTGNSVSITQSGISLSGAEDTATVTQSIGDGNQITIAQSRGDGSVVTLTQSGASNTANITQNP